MLPSGKGSMVIPVYPRLSPEEARVASAWLHTEHSWRGLTDQERAYCRDNLTKAPRYVG